MGAAPLLGGEVVSTAGLYDAGAIEATLLAGRLEATFELSRWRRHHR
jgi:hypothetical protein